MKKITKTRWQKMQELFNGAVDLSLDNRNKFLRDSCGRDTELFNDVEALIKIDIEDDTIINYSSWLSELLPSTQMDHKLVLSKGE